ncbi:MAG: ribonuclease P protein component [Candidatus Peribacteraceae bacterium]|jgi:ribonuclease P protein component
MKLFRLRGRKICERVLKKGTVWRGKTMMIRWLPGAPRHPAANPKVSGIYMGTLVSKKLAKSAVLRNRMRRRCREALRIALKDSQEFSAIQLLLSPRSTSLTCDFAEIQNDIRSFLSSVSSCRTRAS